MNEIERLKQRNELLEKIIKEIRKLDLYECEIDYDWEENSYEIYNLFDIDDFIENVKYNTEEKTKQKK